MRPPTLLVAVAAAAVAGLAQAAVPAHAVLFDWTITSGAPGASMAEAKGVSAVPAGGASVVTGRFQGSNVDLGDGVARSTAGGNAPWAFTQMVRADGSVMWTTTARSQAYAVIISRDVATLSDGRSVITGYFQGAGIDLGDGVSRNSGPSGSRSAFTQMLRADGSVAWTLPSSSANQNYVEGYAVSTAPDGRSVVVGTFQGTDVDLGDGLLRTSSPSYPGGQRFVQMIRADGSVEWTKPMGAFDSILADTMGVSALPDGRVVTTAAFRGTGVDLGDGVPRTSSNGGTETAAYTQMLRADGSVAWTSTSRISGPGFCDAWDVSALPNGWSFITGAFQGVGVDLGDGVPRTSSGAGDTASAFTQGLRPDGSVAWTIASGGDPPGLGGGTSGVAVSARPDSSVVVAGYFGGIDVDLGDGVLRTSPGGGGTAATFTQLLRPGGSVAWTSTSSGPAAGPSFALARGVSALPDGRIAQSGYFQGASINLGDGVMRTSANGGADQSSSSFAQGLVTVPAAPEAPAPVAGDGRITATVAPQPGGLVTSYGVTAAPGGRTCTITPPARECTVTGLTNGTSYTVTATATNAAGVSAASPASAAVTPRPTGLSAAVLPARATLTSGRTARMAIRVVNRKGATAAVTSCLLMPPNVRVVRAPGALRSGSRVCFRLGTVAAGAVVNRSVQVQGLSTRPLRRVIRGTVRAAGMPRVRARPAVVRVLPFTGAAVAG